MTGRPAALGLLFLSLALTACSDCEAKPAQPETERVEAAEPVIAGWQALDPPAAPGALGVDLERTDEGFVATWLEPSEGGGHALRLARLAEGRWGEAHTVAQGEGLVANWADFPRSVRGGDGALYVHLLQRSGDSPYAYEVRLFRSEDAERFEPLGVVHGDRSPTEHGFVSMIPTEDGARLFWLDGRAGADAAEGEHADTAVYTATVAGSTIGPEALIDERACDCCQTDAAIGSRGPLVAFRDRDEREHRDIAVAGLEAGSARLVHDDGWEFAGCPVNGPAIDAEGPRVVVAWFTGVDGASVRVAFSDDGGATFGEPVVVDAELPLGRVDVALLEEGAAVTWLGQDGDDGEVRARFVAGDRTQGAPSVVGRTDADRVSGFPVLAFDGVRLLVAFRDGAEPPRLHVAALDAESLPRGGAGAPPAQEPPAGER